MNSLTIHPDWSALPLRPRDLAVYVNDVRRRDLHVLAIADRPAPHFGQAEFVLNLASVLPPRRFNDVQALPPVGSAIQIRLLVSGHILFDGFVTSHDSRLGSAQEELRVHAEDFLAVRLSGRLGGAWQVSDGAAQFVPERPCVFNDDRTGLSGGLFLINMRQTCIFDEGPTARLWSAAEIIQYLLAAFGAQDFRGPGLGELRRLAGTIYPPPVHTDGLTMREALAHVAGLAGLEVASVRCDDGTHALRFYRPSRVGRRYSVSLQRPAERFDPAQSNLWQAGIRIRRRPSRKGLLVLGQFKRYETTLTLQPGWNTALAGQSYRQYVRSQSDNWLALADVYRKWVLNEAAQYSAAPYNLPAFDASGVHEDFLLRRPRRLEPCLSCDGLHRSQGILVEVSYDAATTWRRYAGPIGVSQDEAAIALADDALPAEYYQAVTAGQLRLRVTATLASDRRLRAELPGDIGAARQIVQLSAAQFAQVLPGSVFYDPDRPPPAQRDDSPRLAQLAGVYAAAASSGVEAELTLGWVDPFCRIGDCVDRIDGREMWLTGCPGGAPHIVAIEHLCQDEWTTRLTITG